MSKYKNLRIDKLLDLANTLMGDIKRGGQLHSRIESAKSILELVALLTAVPQSQADAPEGG
jgi:hypothetical protein